MADPEVSTPAQSVDSGPECMDVELEPTPTQLPWGAEKDRINFPENTRISTSAKPGEFVLQTLFAEYTVLAEKKIAQILDLPADHQKPLSKYLQRGEDATFDQVLSGLGCVAEHSLPSLLRCLFTWYSKQSLTDEGGSPAFKQRTRSKSEKDTLDKKDSLYIIERREFAVNFVYCLVLIEVLKQLPYHPGYDDLINHVISQAFRHCRYRDTSPLLNTSASSGASADSANQTIIADLYAEVMGVLAHSRFLTVRKRFMLELKELKTKEQNVATVSAIINLLMGMKFFRVKMHPIEEFQACVQFLQELGNYFLEVKEKDIKHALAGLFVEILLPVSAVVKNEVNVPVLKNFVESMYPPTLDMSNKKKHNLALFPMVTCLLCVSQKQFFLNNWPYFLTICLSHLKDKESKTCRVALESLYRLVWVYMVRIKCESNTATISRLHSIVSSLFPKGSKVIVPRDAPLNIFVKIIQFIAQERLDFAMKEIIFDLLCVGRPIRNVIPERMSIGLRAFLVIADSLQQKEGDPPMPQTMGVMPSGNTLRFKKTFINKYLSDEQARGIGMATYYPHVRKAFDAILKTLDAQIGKPLLRTKMECLNREPEEIITGDRKPKIDLFRTCVAAVPRLLPDGMSQHELIALLCRLTIHIDDELGKLAFQSLQNIIADLPIWRNDVVRGFVQFTHKEVTDTFPQLLDQCSRRIISVLTQWKTVVQNQMSAKAKDKSTQTGERMEHHFLPRDTLTHKATLHEVEGFALVMLCSCKPIVRKLAGVILKEVRNLFNLLNIPKELEPCVLDVMDTSCPVIIERFLPHLPLPEKIAVLGSSSLDLFGDGRPTTAALSAPALDFQWLADRTSIIWTSAGYHDIATEGGSNVEDSSARSWIECMSIFMHQDYLMGHCPTAIRNAWPILFSRLQLCFKEHMDPNNTQNERASGILSRPGTKKVTNERDLYISLWQNYIVMACCIAPSSHTSEQLRSVSPDLSASGNEGMPGEGPPRSPGYHSTAKDLFKLLVPLIRCETTDIMEAVVMGIGHTNPEAFRDLIVELLPIMKEAIDRKQENVRRRKRRDVLRLALIKMFRAMAEHGIFNESPSGVIEGNNALCFTFVEYIEGARQFLDGENDKDGAVLQEIRLHFSEFVRHLIRSTPVEKRGSLLSRELRYSLFYLFASWSGKFGLTFGHMRGNKEDRLSELQLSAVQAMSAVLCCGPAFDPTGLNEEGYIYAWLDILLAAHEEKIKLQIYKLAQETVVLLLEFNPDVQTLLEWVIDRCYTGAHEVADGCFNALSMVFNNREYPCDHVAMLNLTLLNTGCPRVAVHETAVQLLHLLYKRFYLDSANVTEQAGGADRDTEGGSYISVEKKEKAALQELLLSGPYSRSQLFLSETLARLHPDLTMSMFSEITHRFQTAKPAIKQTLLQYLLPWLHNIELVDPNLQQGHSPLNYLNKPLDDHPDYIPPPLRGDGWGSPQATEMVLNNLLYITAKFGDDHAKEIEDLWASLVACRPNNLKVILRYVFIITGTAPANILPHTKRIIVYLGRAKPERLVDEIMIELQTVEALIFNVERTQTPPYYRFTKKQTGGHEEPEPSSSYHQHMHLDKGQIHTKRHSAEDPQNKLQDEMTPRTNSTASLRSDASTVSSIAVSVKTDSELEETLALSAPKTGAGEVVLKETPVPYPLPMPAYGGYFVPIYELLPAVDLPNPPYQRCNLAVMLLTDLVIDCIGIDWTVHLPLMLHIVFLGLDHSRYLIHEHCKKLLLNLLLVMSAHNDHFSVAKIILSNHAIHEETSLTLPNTINRDLKDISFVEGMEGSGEGPSTNQSVTSSGTIATDSVSSLVDVDLLPSTEDVAKALIDFLVTRKCRPLWSYEDITAKVHSIKSAEQLEHFLKYVLRVFRESVPLAHIEQRWPQVALQLALSCPSRHYAGRSFQIFRALHIPLTSQMLSDVLSRLVETVADHGEDMQGYVTEIMLTLESTIDHLNADFRSFDFAKELFMSTPNLTKEPKLEIKKSATVALRQAPPYRSTSYALAAITRRAITSAPVDVKIDTRQHRCSTGDIETRGKTNLSRSRSVQSLKNASQDVVGQEDKLTILSQLFFVAVTLLESDYEYEFLLAVRLLDKVLRHIQPERPECREKLDKIQSQLKWPTFPGVQSLLLKGCTSPVTAEATWNLLSRLTLCIQAPIIDPSQVIGFPMNVMALLPYLVVHYEEPITVCSEAADHISQMCMEQPGKLENLATVMQLYSRGTFGKDKHQWTKCVVKYIYDVYSNLSSFIIAFLVEVLDKGPHMSQAAILQILHCMVHYLDLTTPPYNTLNSELMRVVSKYMESQHWKEALKILKLCVTKTSTLTMPPPSSSANVSSLEPAILSHTSFAEADISFKKELPGRTIDFTFDMSQVNIIGQQLLELPSPAQDDTQATGDASNKDVASMSISPSMSIAEATGPPGWKIPQPCQKRVRERLVNLLTAYGQTGQIVGLRTSSSVIFSQSSDTMERQASKSTSSEEASVHDIPGDDSSMEQHMRVFDFLNDELDEMMSEGDQFNQGLQPHHQEDTDVESKEDCSSPGSHKGEDVSSDDECQSASPVDEYLPDMRTSSTITLQQTMLDPNRRHSISGSSHSLHSDVSVPDISDLSPSHASPHFSSMSAILSIQNDELDDVWRSHVRRVIMDEPATQNVNTFHLFARLFQEIQRKVQTLTQEACFFLARTDPVKGLANLLLGLLDVVNLASQCPLVYADGETLLVCKMVEQHKFNILEINEIYEDYLMRKDKAMQVLEGLKASLKQQSLGEGEGDVPVEEQAELCWCLYRLHFQLLQLFDAYSKLVADLRCMPKPAEVVDLSDEVGKLRDQLVQAQIDVDNDSESSPIQLDTEHVTASEGEKMILETLAESQTTKAVRLLRSCRRLFQGDVFGTDSNEVETMLFMFCKSQAEAKPGIVAITESNVDLSDVKTRLMEVKIQLSASMASFAVPAEQTSTPAPPPQPLELPRVETEAVAEPVSEPVSGPAAEAELVEDDDTLGKPPESISL